MAVLPPAFALEQACAAMEPRQGAIAPMRRRHCADRTSVSATLSRAPNAARPHARRDAGTRDATLEAGLNLVAVDNTLAMIRSVWAGNTPHRSVLCGDWLRLPLRDACLDLALIDGGLPAISFPDAHRELAGELHRVLKPGGLVRGADLRTTRPHRNGRRGAVRRARPQDRQLPRVQVATGHESRRARMPAVACVSMMSGDATTSISASTPAWSG